MSRLTFRDPARDACYQKQRRDEYMAEGTPSVPHLDVGRAEIRRVSYALAKQIILKYEWLGTMTPSRHHYGLFFGPWCAGVVCYTFVTATVYGHKEFCVTRDEFVTLSRGACVHWAPPGANSRLVSVSLRLLAEDSDCKVVVAYSDEDAGEIGTIYQACNWFYIGRGQSNYQFIAPNGRIYDNKIVYDLRERSGRLDTVTWSEQRDALLKAGWQVQMSNPKHRYAYPLTKSMRKRLEGMAQPYPKRAAEATQ